MAEYKIKRVKDYLRDGPPQFTVLNRYGKNCYGSIFFNETEISSIEGGTIEAVERVSDNRIFKHGDAVLTTSYGRGYIIEFLDDLIHCYITLFDQEIKYEKIPLNKVKINIELPLEGDFEEYYKEGDPYD